MWKGCFSLVCSVQVLRTSWIFLHLPRRVSIWRPHNKALKALTKEEEEPILPIPKDWTLLKMDLVSQVPFWKVISPPLWASFCENQLLQMSVGVFPVLKSWGCMWSGKQPNTSSPWHLGCAAQTRLKLLFSNELEIWFRTKWEADE